MKEIGRVAKVRCAESWNIIRGMNTVSARFQIQYFVNFRTLDLLLKSLLI